MSSNTHIPKLYDILVPPNSENEEMITRIKCLFLVMDYKSTDLKQMLESDAFDDKSET